MSTISEYIPYFLPAIFAVMAAPSTAAAEPTSLPRVSDVAGSQTAVAKAGLSSTAPSDLKSLSISAQQPGWLDASIHRIESYRSVEDGWKGSESVAPTSRVIDDATDFLVQISKEMPDIPRPLISADEDGVICLYWQHDEVLATISIHGDDTYAFYAEGFDDPVRSDEESIGSPIPPRLISTMTGVTSLGTIGV